jgi:predicted alpha/beta-fold hydrolase
VLILFPGLTGGSGDTYVQHAVQAARGRGIRACVFNSRGTADSPVTTPQFYSASFTGDAK